MIDIKKIESRRLSTFLTNHCFINYGEFATVEEFLEYREWARARDLPILVLGNGSNVLFTRFQVRTLVLKNRLEAKMEILSAGVVKASSSLSIMRILKYCERESLDSFYYLASVPATVGGAIAMNAGSASETIFDFLESVTYWDGESIVVKPATELIRTHRMTDFTGRTDKLIIEAVFRFPARKLESSEIQKRVKWCHDNQDLSAPNCGSVFRECDRRIMKKVRWIVPWGIHIPFFFAQYSRKVNNWIICRNKSSWPIVFLIRIVQLIHRAFGSKAIPEIVEVD